MASVKYLFILLIYSEGRIEVSSASSICSIETRSPGVLVDGIDEQFQQDPKLVEPILDDLLKYLALNCTHPSQPVWWEVSIQLPRDKFEFGRNFHQSHIWETSGILYSSFVVLLYKHVELPSKLLFACKNPCGNATYLEISNGRYSPSWSINAGAPSNVEFSQLANELLTNEDQNQDISTCELMLIVKVEHGTGGNYSLLYKWVPSNGIEIEDEEFKTTRTTTDQGIYLRGVGRNLLQRRNCARQLQNEETCANCTEVKPVVQVFHQKLEAHINSVLFRAKVRARSTTYIYKGVFSITLPRKYYFAWEVPMEEMVDLHPVEVYVGHNFTMYCKVSTIYFAYGTRIALFRQNENGEDEVVKELRGKEEWSSGGYRAVTASHTFDSEEGSSISIRCSAPLWDWSTWVNKSVSTVLQKVQEPALVTNISSLPQIMVSIHQEMLTIVCQMSGNPKPIIEWTFPYEQQENRGVEIVTNNISSTEVASVLIFPPITKNLVGTYLCRGSNGFGEVERAFNVVTPPEGDSTAVRVWVSSSLGVLIVVGITTILVIYRRIVIQRKEYRTKTEDAIREFREGLKRKSDAKILKQRIFFNFDANHRDSILCADKSWKGEQQEEHHFSILELPYDDSFEVEKEKWIIEDTSLGQGAFGFVKKGMVELEDGSDHKKTVVAIKMLKSNVDIDDFKGFLTELKIMAYIGHHANVVSLVAACTQNIDERDVMLGVEFCANGSLKDYLKDKRNLFRPIRGSMTEDDNSHIDESSRRTYANLSNVIALTEMDLYTWAYQIANGMEYLGAKRVLHGDLATRNVLLTTDKIAKISDFGLSRVLLDTGNYTKKSKVPLPWKWMAIESLTTLKFSYASDVWAYGVTLWECFSLGEVPFAGISYGPEFVQQLADGLRLSKPSLATDYVYNIMNHCWTAESERRVTFAKLKQTFTELLEIFTSPTPDQSRAAEVVRNTLRPFTSSSEVSSRPLQQRPVAQPRRIWGRDNQENLYTNNAIPQVQPNLYLNV